MKDAYYFSHDSNASQDPKILAMRSVYGWEGYGWYWMLIEMMREQQDYRLDISGKYVFNAFALQMHCTSDAAENFIMDCINEFNLFDTDGTTFWSNSLLRRMSEKDEKSIKDRLAAQTRWDKELSKCKRNADALQTQCDPNAIKERKGKENKDNIISPATPSKESETKTDLIPYEEIISHLNKKAGTEYKTATKTTRQHIKARWNEGFRLEQFIKVVDIKCREWIHTEQAKYLRPETLFGTKFESYLNQPESNGRASPPIQMNNQNQREEGHHGGYPNEW